MRKCSTYLFPRKGHVRSRRCETSSYTRRKVACRLIRMLATQENKAGTRLTRRSASTTRTTSARGHRSPRFDFSSSCAVRFKPRSSDSPTLQFSENGLCSRICSAINALRSAELFGKMTPTAIVKVESALMKTNRWSRDVRIGLSLSLSLVFQKRTVAIVYEDGPADPRHS